MHVRLPVSRINQKLWLKKTSSKTFALPSHMGTGGQADVDKYLRPDCREAACSGVEKARKCRRSGERASSEHRPAKAHWRLASPPVKCPLCWVTMFCKTRSLSKTLLICTRKISVARLKQEWSKPHSKANNLRSNFPIFRVDYLSRQNEYS